MYSQSQRSRRVKSEKEIEKEVIQVFSSHGYMLRPSSLRMCIEFLISQTADAQAHDLLYPLTDIIGNIRMLQNNNLNLDTAAFIEEQAMEESLQIYQNKMINPSQSQRTTLLIEDDGMEIEKYKTNVRSKAEPSATETVEEYLGDLITRKLATSIVILNAFQDFPNFTYDRSKQTFVQSEKLPQVFSNADEKINTYKQRLILVREKMVKSKDYLFPFQNQVNTTNSNVMKISEVGSLLGNKGEKNVLGIIFQGEGNKYFLQDLSTSIPLEFEKNLSAGNSGYFLNNHIVIATGYYSNDKLHVRKLHQPQISEEACEKLFVNKDYFGAYTKVSNVLGNLLSLELGNSRVDLSSSQPAERKKAVDKAYSKFVDRQKSIGIFDLKMDKYFKKTRFEDLAVFILSCFHLDKAEVLNKFRSILEKCSLVQPLMFIIMGELSSNQKIDTVEEFEELDQNIEAFLELLEEFPDIMKNCFWVFIPAPQEFGTGCMPTHQYPPSIMEKLSKRIPLFINGSNPLKMSILNKKILIIRKDLLKEMRRNSIIKVEDGEECHNVVSTIIAQSHLMPLSVYSQPLLWDYDFAFRLFHLPDIVILADGSCYYSEPIIYDKTKFVYPGNFDRDGSFLAIRPLTGEIESHTI